MTLFDDLKKVEKSERLSIDTMLSETAIEPNNVEISPGQKTIVQDESDFTANRKN